MAQQTTLRANALPGALYGSFAGKVGITWLDKGPFLLVEHDFDMFYEVQMRMASGTIVRSRLWNKTDSVAVTGSELTTTSATMVRLRSGLLDLDNGSEYQPQFVSEGGSGAYIAFRLV